MAEAMLKSEAANNLESVIVQIKEMWNRIGEFKAGTIEEHSNDETFIEKFNSLDTNIIDPVVASINRDLRDEGLSLSLAIFSDKQLKDKGNNRKFYQIVLKNSKKRFNILASPYLLIEGYPNSGQVRITQSSSSNEGEILNVDNLNDNLFKSSLASFLSQSAPAIK